VQRRRRGDQRRPPRRLLSCPAQRKRLAAVDGGAAAAIRASSAPRTPSELLPHTKDRLLAAEHIDQTIELLRERSFRDRQRWFLAEGLRNVVRAAERPGEIVKLVLSNRLLPAAGNKITQRLKQAGVPSVSIGADRFRTLARLPRASGIFAIVRQRWCALHHLRPRRRDLWLLVERIHSPGNLGSLLRTAEAVGATGLLIAGFEVDPYDPAVLRGSMGSLLGLRLSRTSLSSLEQWRRRHHLPVIAANPSSSQDFHTFPCPAGPLVLAVGGERRGLSGALEQLCTTQVRIPMVGAVDSLNVAVAGSLLLYEVLRQRKRPC
jgi:TrmH family RNA methyltransferase